MPTVEVLELSEELANKHEAPTCKWRLCVYGWKYRVNDELKATQPPGEWWWNKQLQGWWVPVDDFDKVERLLMDVQRVADEAGLTLHGVSTARAKARQVLDVSASLPPLRGDAAQRSPDAPASVRRSRSASPAGGSAGGSLRRSKRLAGEAPEKHDHDGRIYLTRDADAGLTAVVGSTALVADALEDLQFEQFKKPRRWKLLSYLPDEGIADLQAACNEANVKLHTLDGHVAK